MDSCTLTRTAIRVSAAVVAASLLAACRQDAGSGRDACSLVGRNDVRHVLSRTDVSPGDGTGGGTRSGCTYTAGPVRVEVAVDREAKRGGFTSDRKTYEGKGGDVRFKFPYGKDFTYVAKDGSAGAFEILNGHATVRVVVTHAGDPAGAARRLAQTASGRL